MSHLDYLSSLLTVLATLLGVKGRYIFWCSSSNHSRISGLRTFEFEAMWRTDKKVVLKHGPCA